MNGEYNDTNLGDPRETPDEKEIYRLQEQLAERTRERDAALQQGRCERCIECGGFVSDYVEEDTGGGRICRPCETVIALRAQLEAVTRDNSAMAEELHKIASILGLKVYGFDELPPAVEAVTREKEEALEGTRRARCPSCGNATLRLGSDGQLVCTWIECKNPCAINSVDTSAATSALAEMTEQRDKREKDAIRWHQKLTLTGHAIAGNEDAIARLIADPDPTWAKDAKVVYVEEARKLRADRDALKAKLAEFDKNLYATAVKLADAERELARADDLNSEISTERDEAEAKLAVAKKSEAIVAWLRQHWPQYVAVALAALETAQSGPSDTAILDWIEKELKKWRTGMLHTEAPAQRPEWRYYVEIDGGYRKAYSLREAVIDAMQQDGTAQKEP